MKGVCAYYFHCEMFRKQEEAYADKEKFDIMREIYRILTVLAESKYWTVEALF